MEPAIVARFPERSQIVELADTTLMALHATKTREQAVAVRRSGDQGASWT